MVEFDIKNNPKREYVNLPVMDGINIQSKW